MGAVQKLATVTMAGLVALATVLVVYLADEPNRRGGETGEQNHIQLERGTELFITYCLQCHGPSGFGSLGGDEPARPGAPINQSSITDEQLADANNKPRFQSDDPAQQVAAQTYIRYSITYGKPETPLVTTKAMPAFRQELNVEEINDLVYLIMYGDWNYVHNQAVLTTGETVAQAACDATPPGESAEASAEQCDKVENPDPVYPTVPPAANPSGGGQASPAASPAASPVAGGGVQLEAQDPYAWSVKEFSVKPGDTITVTNSGFSNHDFSVDAWGINEVLPPGEPVTITVPADAQPGDFEFYCSVPGHKQNGMVGTVTVEAP